MTDKRNSNAPGKVDNPITVRARELTGALPASPSWATIREVMRTLVTEFGIEQKTAREAAANAWRYWLRRRKKRQDSRKQ